MPVERIPMSRSQFAELMGIEPSQLRWVAFDEASSTVTLVVERAEMQTSGTCPPLSDNTSKRKPTKK